MPDRPPPLPIRSKPHGTFRCHHIYPLSIKADAPVGRFKLDLRDVLVNDVSIRSNVGSAEITFGDILPGVTPVSIDGQLMSIKLSIPQHIGLRMEHTGVITYSDFTGESIAFGDKHYVTEGYDEAECKFDIFIQTTIGKVNVIRY